MRCGCLRRYGGGRHSSRRLVCFPWAGGGASAYRRFTLHVPAGYEFLAVQYPGREDRFREQPLQRMDSLVRHVLADLVHDSARPLVLFGHSMGALVAYEVALALKQHTGQEPEALIVSGFGAPHIDLSYPRCSFAADDSEFLADIRRLGGTPQALLETPMALKALLPPLRADYEILETYARRPPGHLSCPLIAWAGDQDTSVSPESLAAWEHYSTGPCRQRWIGGGSHFYLRDDPRALAHCLADWQEMAAGMGGAGNFIPPREKQPQGSVFHDSKMENHG